MRITFVDTGLSHISGGANQSRYGRGEIGALLVASCVESKGHNVTYIRPDTEDTKNLIAAVEATAPEVVVLFPYTYTKHLADVVGRSLKGKAVIIYGGYHVGVGPMPKITIDEGVADYVVSGRGEHILPELIERLAKGERPKQKIFRGKPNDSFEGLPWLMRIPELEQNLHQEPLPFMPPKELCDNPGFCLSLSGSVGCDARCDFCPSWMISKATHRLPQDVVDEMLHLQKQFGPSIFALYDPLFNADRDWLLDLCSRMKYHGPFAATCLPDFRLDLEMVQAMKSAGIYLVKMGLEFVDDNDRVGRGKREADPQTAFELCHEVGIIARAFFMLGQKGVTKKGVARDLEILHKLPFRADQLRPNFEVPFPGTQTWQNMSMDETICGPEHWHTEVPVYSSEFSAKEWLRIRDELVLRYHTDPRQTAHWEKKMDQHPELRWPIQNFLNR